MKTVKHEICHNVLVVINHYMCLLCYSNVILPNVAKQSLHIFNIQVNLTYPENKKDYH